MRKLLVRQILCVGVLFSFPYVAGAQWVQTSGPEGAVVSGIVVSGSSLLAATAGGGVFRSANNGADWIASNSGLANKNVQCLAVYGGIAYAGTDAGVFRQMPGRTADGRYLVVMMCGGVVQTKGVVIHAGGAGGMTG